MRDASPPKIQYFLPEALFCAVRINWGGSVFEFMGAAFYALVGVVCLSVAVVIVYAVVVGIYRGLKGGGHRGRK